MQHSTPYTPQQNGVAERKNRSFKEMATGMIEVWEINPKLWAEAISYAAHIQEQILPQISERYDILRGMVW